MEDRKLVDFAHWLNDHPGEWNLWPHLIPIQADRRGYGRIDEACHGPHQKSSV